MAGDTRHSARAFVRSLNILLKFARLYEFGHVRTMAQFETAWKELHSALDESRDTGLLLGASGNQILLDGVPLGAAAAEKSFLLPPESPAFTSRQILPNRNSRDLCAPSQAEMPSRVHSPNN
jgi:hypothetical protein